MPPFHLAMIFIAEMISNWHKPICRVCVIAIIKSFAFMQMTEAILNMIIVSDCKDV